jgi:hypothetical protein
MPPLDTIRFDRVDAKGLPLGGGLLPELGCPATFLLRT